MAAPILDEAGIFNTARHMQAPEDRRLYLDTACGNDKRLLARIEALLHVHEEEHGFLETPAVPMPALAGTIVCDGPGTQVGLYKLMEQIGEGGFGVVFTAEQQQPIRRSVALKILKPGMDSRDVLARFQAERQALALMDHPNIARVLDAGETASGRPYFVMELVKGVPITRYCDEHRLTPRARLGIFISVCQAVQHAHQKGIIHRDLKPTNVLVAAYDGQAVPKVIDFGVAKALGERLTERSVVTGIGGIIGTLEYLSPESAEFNARDIDTRADIYSLGAMLYELLTGTTPLTHERLERAPMSEVLQAIREEDPPKPSARLQKDEGGRMKQEKRAIRRFGSFFIRHPSSFHELDWIVMKALDKDRSRRYATANGLARDIERYLQDEPVEACPPSAWYRIRKFAAKNRKLLGAAAAFALLLTAGIIVSTWLAARALQAEHAAGEALAAEAQRRRQTRDALEMLTSHVIDEWLARQPGLLPEHRKFLEKAVASYEELARDTRQEETSRADAALALQRVGSIRLKLGQIAEAEAAHRRSRDLYEQLASDFPAVPGYRLELARGHTNLGIICALTERVLDAEHAYRQALRLQQQLAADFPAEPAYRYGLAQTQTTLGNLLQKLGRALDAELAYREGVKLQQQLVGEFPKVPEYRVLLARNHDNLGCVLAITNRVRDAEAAYRQALELQQQLDADFPNMSSYRHGLAGTQSNLGNLLISVGRTQDAEQAFREALNLELRLSAEFPTVPGYRQFLAIVQNNLGILLRATGRAQDAENAHRAALKLQRQLAADNPTVPAYRHELARSHTNLGAVLEDVKRVEEAEGAYGEAIEVYRQLTADFPSVPDYHNGLAGAMVNLADLLRRGGKPGPARQLLEQAAPHHQAALEANPRHPAYRQFFRNNRLRLAQTLVDLGDHDAAAETATEFLQAASGQAVDVYNAACIWARCASLVQGDLRLSEAQRQERAQVYADRAMAELRRAVESGYKNVAHMMNDPNLNSLRSRADFQRLLADLQAMAPSATK